MKRKHKLIAWIIGGAALALGPFWGLLGTVVGMIMAFGHLSQGDPDVEVLATDISIALYTTVAGYIAGPIGAVIIIVAVVKMYKDKKNE
jgi:biopolymer transport protein ExbB/TolQ